MSMSVLALIVCLAAMLTHWTSPSMHECQHVPISGHVTPTQSHAQQSMLAHAYCMETTTTLVAKGEVKIW